MKRANSGGNSKQQYTSYQQGVYYAADQTKTLENTTQAYHQADDTANKVLQQMSTQRQQIQGAHDDVWQMRMSTEQAKRELEELQAKYRAKKNRLYMWIAGLAVTDFLLFLRILQCRGNFYCLWDGYYSKETCMRDGVMVVGGVFLAIDTARDVSWENENILMLYGVDLIVKSCWDVCFAAVSATFRRKKIK